MYLWGRTLIHVPADLNPYFQKSRLRKGGLQNKTESAVGPNTQSHTNETKKEPDKLPTLLSLSSLAVSSPTSLAYQYTSSDTDYKGSEV